MEKDQAERGGDDHEQARGEGGDDDCFRAQRHVQPVDEEYR